MALVDSYGRELKEGRPVLGEIGAWHGHAYPSYPSRGLTPEALSSIFMEADMMTAARHHSCARCLRIWTAWTTLSWTSSMPWARASR